MLKTFLVDYRINHEVAEETVLTAESPALVQQNISHQTRKIPCPSFIMLTLHFHFIDQKAIILNSPTEI